ncbi:unnamed protein product, partial [Pylaiella littoralis]
MAARDNGAAPVTPAARWRRYRHQGGSSTMRRLLAGSVLTPLLLLLLELRVAPCFAAATRIFPGEAAKSRSYPLSSIPGSSSCSLPDPETGLNSLENVWVETPCSGLEYHRHHDDQAYKREKLSPAVHSVSGGGGGGGGLRGRNDNTNDGSSADDRCYRCVPATTFGGGGGGSFFASGDDGDGDDDGFNGNGKGHELRTIGRGRGGPGSDEPLVGRGRLRRSRDRRRRRPREHSGESEEDEDRGIAGTRLAEAEEAGSVKRGGGG